MCDLYQERYRDFTVKHFHEQLAKRHNYVLGYTVTKLHLQREGLVMRAKTRSAHRKKRPRRPMVGMMLHQDASTHAWLPDDTRKYDLVVTMEDATSALYSAFLVDEEARRRASRDCVRWWLRMACSAHSTPIVAAITSSRRGRRQGLEERADAGWTSVEPAWH